MSERKPSIEDVAAAVQQLVFEEKWVGAANFVAAHEPELLSDLADALLAQQAVNSAGNQQELIAYEDWRGFLASCRRFGRDGAVERQTRLTTLRQAAGTGGAESLDASIQALELIDPHAQPVTHAVHAGDVALVRIQTASFEEQAELRETVAVLARSAETLAANKLFAHRQQYHAALAEAFVRIHTATHDPSDLERAVKAFDTAGFYLLDAHVRTGDPRLLDDALAIFERALESVPRDDAWWPKRRYNVALAHHFRFGVTGTRSDIDEAIDGSDAALGAVPPGHEWRRTLLNDLSLFLHDRYTAFGDPVDLDRAIELEQQIVDTPSDDELGSSNLFGMLLHSRFQLSGDPEDLNRSIELIAHAKDSAPPDSEEWALYAMNLGIAQRTRFRSFGAIEDIDRAVQSLRASLTGGRAGPHDIALRTYNLGLAQLSRFEATGRREDIDAAIGSFTDSVGSLRDRRTMTYVTDLGVALRRRYERFGNRNDLQAALDHFVAAHKRFPKGSSEWARLVGNLGTAYMLAARHDDDPAMLDPAVEALRLATTTPAALLQDRARNWSDLADALTLRYERRGDPADIAAAEDSYRRSLAPFQDGRWAEHTIAVARGLGALLLRTNRAEEARTLLATGMDALENLYRAQVLIADRQAWLAQDHGLHALAALAAARADDATGAADALERSRARALGETLERDRSDLARVAEANPAAHHAYVAAAERVRLLEQVEREANPERSGQVRAEVAGARADLDAALAGIRTVAGFESFLETPGLDDVAEAMADGRALAYVAVTRAGAAIVLCHRAAGAATIEVLPSGPLTYDELVELLVGVESRPGPLIALFGAPLEALDEALGPLLQRLGASIVSPLATRLRDLGIEAVAIVACGVLGIVPLHAATYAHEGRETCLIDEVDVSYAPSATALVAAERAAAGAIGPRVFVAVANPQPAEPPLPHAEAEADIVAALFAGSSTIVRRQHEARADIFERDLAGATHVHLACHGYYVPDDPSSSHLRLANNTRLTLIDLLDRRGFDGVRLVVASACQTALTDFVRLPDEALGLPGAFLQAGAAAVVGTLWPVADLSTALLVERFYELHLGESLPPAAALAGAQRWLRAATAEELAARFDARLTTSPTPAVTEAAAHGAALFGLKDPDNKPYFARPSCWAPFIMVGA